MIQTRRTIGPPWWDKFLGHVRTNGGVVEEALSTMGLYEKNHYRYAQESPELAEELAEAVEAGKRERNVARANRILKSYAAGESIEAAGAKEGAKGPNVYMLLERAGVMDKYEQLRDERRARTKDYKSGVAFLNEQLDKDRDVYEDGAALSYVALVRKIVEAVDLDSKQLREIGLPGLRNKVLRTIGAHFAEEENFPLFLEEE